MKILIVDDSNLRAERLLCHLIERGVCTKSDVEIADCVVQAKAALEAAYFDALVLDVVLPNRAGERADPKWGLGLLNQLARSPRFRKPEKIIGLTAHVSDIAAFKAEFEKHCLTVIEADISTSQWKETVVNSLDYTASSKLARCVSENNINVLTVHGIRTFGEWQNRFHNIVKRRFDGVSVSSYRYGYFSAIAFMVPFFRKHEVDRLASHLRTVFEKSPDQDFYVFCHSFGTFLVSNAIKKLVGDGYKIPIKLLVLSGSVLPERFDWGFFFRVTKAKVVNDCADQDYVLWLSKALTLGTGMAGKTGFLGMENDRLINRYFVGGHSSYFDGNEFMERYWLPLLMEGERPSAIDCRKPSPIIHGFFEKIVCGLGRIKPIIYLFALIFGAFFVFRG